MGVRTLRRDAQGLYVKYDNRIFRPDPNDLKVPSSGLVVGNPYHFYYRGWGKAPSVNIYGPNCGVVFTTADAVKPKAKKPGTDEIRTTLGGAGVIVRMNDSSKKPLEMTVSSTIAITWDEWDKFVEDINVRRMSLPVERIAASLTKDLEAEDQLQAYIKEKGLV